MNTTDHIASLDADMAATRAKLRDLETERRSTDWVVSRPDDQRKVAEAARASRRDLTKQISTTTDLMTQLEHKRNGLRAEAAQEQEREARQPAHVSTPRADLVAAVAAAEKNAARLRVNLAQHEGARAAALRQIDGACAAQVAAVAAAEALQQARAAAHLQPGSATEDRLSSAALDLAAADERAARAAAAMPSLGAEALRAEGELSAHIARIGAADQGIRAALGAVALHDLNGAVLAIAEPLQALREVAPDTARRLIDAFKREGVRCVDGRGWLVVPEWLSH